MFRSCNAGCHAGSVNDAEIRQQMQLMEETHRLTVQQMVVTHSNELENLASKTRQLQSELQTKSVSVKFSACLLCCSVSRVRKNKKMGWITYG